MTFKRKEKMKTVNQDGMIIEFDCEAVMRDNTIIRYDVYRPDKEGKYPCITTYGPYGKGMHFSQGYSLFWHDMKEKYPEILKGTRLWCDRKETCL